MVNLVWYVSLCEGLRAGAGSLRYIVHVIVDRCGSSANVIKDVIIGTYSARNFPYVELSLPGTKVSWNMEHSLMGHSRVHSIAVISVSFGNYYPDSRNECSMGPLLSRWKSKTSRNGAHMQFMPYGTLFNNTDTLILTENARNSHSSWALWDWDVLSYKHIFILYYCTENLKKTVSQKIQN